MTAHHPFRILHTMLRVTDLEASLRFYCNHLGMRELRREVYDAGEFTLSFIGYGNEQTHTVLELTYNHDKRAYAHGDHFGHVALEVEDIARTCRRLRTAGIEIIREPGPMMHEDQTGKRDVIAFIADPDGNRVELIQAAE